TVLCKYMFLNTFYCSLEASAIRGVGLAVFGDLLFVGIPDREQHRLGIDKVAALLAVVLEDARLDDRIHRARLLAEAAEDALGEIDVVARGAARAVGALVRLDGNRERRAH